MAKKQESDLVTIKVTKKAAKNFKLAAAYSDKPQYEMSEEGSFFVLGKYMNKKNKTVRA